ncbi:hypothetical protein ACFPK9_05425 [Rubritalea spongiae]|uniref:Tetratricopeptide repeat protein n=1 Tax=Rubritalea spongiae TaxID=430797 RepID=A0ABW5E4X7_9BACT
MKWVIASCFALSALSTAEVAVTETVTEEVKSFDYQTVIAEPLKELGEPAIRLEVGEPNLLVFSPSLKAQEHVRQGFAMIHASWDFEAYRHFATALEADPQCLMAYCGIVLALTNPEHEFKEQRAKAFNRMLSLAEHKEGEEFVYPENERMYAVAIAELMANGLQRGAATFRQLAESYPNDLQAQLFALLLSRGGYNSLGNPRLQQRETVAKLEELYAEYPNEPMVLNFLLMAQAEAPYQAVDFKGYMLPKAKRLVELSDGKVPSWQAFLGYVAWRSGELEIAEAAFAEAVRLYDIWRVENKIQPADCEGLLRAQLFFATVLHAEGEQEAALAEIDAVTRFCAPITREYSTGALTAKWIAGLLPLKMALEEDDFALAADRLPEIGKVKQDNLMPFEAIVTAYKLYIDTRTVAKDGKHEAAKRGHAKMAALLTEVKGKQGLVSKSPEFGDYVRELQALGVLHKSLTGDVTEQQGMINVWYQAAADAQTAGSRLLPPNILYPLEYKLGVIQLDAGNEAKAKESFEKALLRQPSYFKAAEGLK